MRHNSIHWSRKCGRFQPFPIRLNTTPDSTLEPENGVWATNTQERYTSFPLQITRIPTFKNTTYRRRDIILACPDHQPYSTYFSHTTGHSSTGFVAPSLLGFWVLSRLCYGSWGIHISFFFSRDGGKGHKGVGILFLLDSINVWAMASYLL